MPPLFAFGGEGVEMSLDAARRSACATTDLGVVCRLKDAAGWRGKRH